AKGDLFTRETLKRGVYMHPRHNMFLSTAHSEADIDFALEATKAAFDVLAARRSIRADVGGGDDLLPASKLAPDQLGVASGTQRPGPDAEPGKRLFHLGPPQGGGDLGFPTPGDLRRYVGRCREAEPVGGDDIREARLPEGRDVGQRRRPFIFADRERTHTPR